MTQPAGPYPFAVQTSPLAPPGVGAPLPPQGIDWAAIQQQEAEQRAQETATEDQSAEEAHRAALREEIGVGETAASQFARGALDAFLAPGALVGLGAQTVGELWSSEGLSKFGRDLGRASSGRAAAEALGFVTGDTDRADRYRARIDQQAEARPTLALISRMAGATAFGLSLGAGSTASKAASTITANAAEGAGAGAQAAYENLDDAPLKDVLVAAGVGALLGGGLATAGEGVAAGVGALKNKVRSAELDKVFGKVQQFADERMIKTAIGNDARTMRILTDNGKDFGRVARVAEKMREANLPSNSDEMLGAITRQADDATKRLTKLATDLDSAGIKPASADLFGEVYDQVNRLKSMGTGDAQAVAAAVERQVAPFRDSLAIKQADNFGNDVVIGYRDPSFTDLRRFKSALGQALKWHKRAPSISDDAMEELYGNVARRLDAAADAAGPEVGAAWRRANQDTSDWLTVQSGLEEELQRRLKNRFISPSDYGTGIAGALATMITSGNPLASLAVGAAGALGNRALRYGGSRIAEGLANRFAKMRVHVPLAKAGGREGQEVLSLVARSKRFIEETAERAGDNPNVRETAANAAREVAAEQVARAAGEFDPGKWRAANPVAKVVHRSQILDQAAEDVAGATQTIGALRPPVPEAFDVARIGRLTKDADGPAAIGKAQAAAEEILTGVPPTPGGSAAGREIRMTLDALRVADAPQAFVAVHRLSNQLDALGANASATGLGDVMAQADFDYAGRATDALREALSDDAFGSAGRHYRALVAAPPETAQALADPAALRSLLLELKEPGQLTAAAREIAEQIQASHAAVAALSGGKKAAAPKALAAWQKLIQDAEDATLVDGRPMADLFDIDVEHGPAVSPENTVLETVGAEVDKIVPVLKRERGAGIGFGKKLRAAPGIIGQDLHEQNQTYQRRMQQLTDAVTQPGQLAAQDQIRGGAVVAAGVSDRLQQLLNDMPKPLDTIRGKQQLSSDELRRANAMWEATMEPLSVFQDFQRGMVDYDKSQYAWKQYPGLQQAAQAGVIDVITNDLDEKERAAMPDPILSQLDYMLGFGGKLQPNVDHSFAARISALPPVAQSDQPQPNAMLDLPGAEPTFTQRLAGAS